MKIEVMVRFSNSCRDAAVDTPSLAYQTDAGYDLAAWLPDGPVAVYPEERVDIPIGMAICPPPGVGMRIIARSSTWQRLGLEVVESLIDPGYQGDLKIRLVNRSQRQQVIQHRQRLAQAIFFPILPVLLVPVAEFPMATARGKNGLGSSGQ